MLDGLPDLLWNWCRHATLLAAAVALLAAAFGRWLTPDCRHALWLLALARFALPIVPTSVWALGGSLPTATIDAPVTWSATRGLLPEHAGEPAPALPFAPKVAAAWRLPWLETWAAGALLGSAWLALRWRAGQRWLARQPACENARLRGLLEECRRLVGVRQPVALLVSAELASPATIGWRRPRVLLPAAVAERFGDDELRMVLTHELTHVRRGDAVVALFAELVRALHWWNPAAWWVRSALAAAREAACDAAALRTLGAGRRIDYGRTLLRACEFGTEARRGGLGRRGNIALAVAMFGPRRELRRRIAMIAKAKEGRTGVRGWFGAALLALAAWGGLVERRTAAEEPRSAPPMAAALPPAPAAQLGADELKDQLVLDIRIVSADLAALLDRLPPPATPEPKGRRTLNPTETALLQELLAARTDVSILSAPRVTVFEGQAATVEIAGLDAEQETNRQRSFGSPILSKIPYVNRLFKTAPLNRTAPRVASLRIVTKATVAANNAARLQLKIVHEWREPPTVRPNAQVLPNPVPVAAAAATTLAGPTPTPPALPSKVDGVVPGKLLASRELAAELELPFGHSLLATVPAGKDGNDQPLAVLATVSRPAEAGAATWTRIGSKPKALNALPDPKLPMPVRGN